MDDDVVADIASHYNLAAEIYDDLYTEPAHKAEDAYVGRLLANALVPTPLAYPILDLGCGTGHMLTMHPMSPTRYVGVDVSAEMVKVARVKFPDHIFHTDDAEQFLARRPAASCAGIVATYGVWSYMQNPETTAKEVARVLVDGGGFLVMAYSVVEDPRPNLREDTHALRYTVDEFRWLFEDANLHVQVEALSDYALIAYGRKL